MLMYVYLLMGVFACAVYGANQDYMRREYEVTWKLETAIVLAWLFFAWCLS